MNSTSTPTVSQVPRPPKPTITVNNPTKHEIFRPDRAIAEEVARLKRRRTMLWAGGVAVIVAAGAFMGAQLKTTQQAKQKLEAEEAAKSQSSSQAVGGDNVKAAQVVRSSTSPSAVDLQKQIATLEEGRAALVHQKMYLERKIEEVRKKKQWEQAFKDQQRAAQESQR